MSKLLDTLKEYGVDTNEVMSRFMQDESLYLRCVRMFFADENIHLLGQAISERHYEDAFTAAHTLKGISSNMGFAPLHAVVSTLVEQLRNKQYEDLDALYTSVSAEYQKISALWTDLQDLL